LFGCVDERAGPSDIGITIKKLQRKKKGESQMAIEWPDAPESSEMTVVVPDNWPTEPAGPPNILVASVPWKVNIGWTVPEPHNMEAGGSFQLRAYAESIGPGQEIQVGETLVEPVVPGQVDYAVTIEVPANTLKGEGEEHHGVPVSGVYKIIAVLQHLNPGPTWISGFAEETIRMFLSP
jgi:hypothetical protein